MFIVFGVVLILLGVLQAAGIVLDVFLAWVPILFARKTANYQSLCGWCFMMVLTYIVCIACAVWMFADAFMPAYYFGLKPIFVSGVYCLVVAAIEFFWPV